MSRQTFCRATLILLAVLALSALSRGAAAQLSGETQQWRVAEWPTGRPVSLFDLVELGYEVRAYQPGFERSWLYLQKERKLFRCLTPETETGKILCQELVSPE